MKVRSALLALGILVTAVGTAAAQQPADAAAAAGPPPLSDAEAAGNCRTPREAIYTLLYWIQEGIDRVDRDRAAACLDAAAVADPSELPDLAYKLKKTLDIKGDLVKVERIPTDPAYVNAVNVHRYTLEEMPAVSVVKQGDRWVISAATIERIPELYAGAVPPLLENIVRRLPSVLREPVPVLGVAGWQLIGVVLLIFFALLLQKLTVWIVTSYVQRLTNRAWIKKAGSHIGRPIGGLAMAGVFYVGIPWLQFSVRVASVAQVATTVLAVISTAWLFYRLIDVFTDWLLDKAGHTETKLDDQLIPLLRKTLKVFTAVIGVIFVLQNLDVDVGSLLAGLGLGGLAFALAAKDTIANFFGSVVIFVDKPFQVGDWIVIGSVDGMVEEVGFRTTKVRTFYDSLITVPNAQMTSSSIDNFGMRTYRRYSTTVGLTYDSPPEKIQAFLEGVRAILQAMPEARKDKYLIEFKEFGESSLNMMIYCFFRVPTWNDEMRARTKLNLEMMRLAREVGVSFAFPTRTLHIDSQATPTEPPRPESKSAEELAAAVTGFGPGGQRSRLGGVKITYGYDCGTEPPPPEKSTT